MIFKNKTYDDIFRNMIQGLMVALFSGFWTRFFSIAIITSPSIDEKVVLISPFPPQKGFLVAFTNQSVVPNKIIVKKVIAIQGESCPKLRLASTDKKPLTQLIVPNESYFVAGDHEESFDSRYEEFGLISKNQIIGLCFKLA